MRETAGMLIFNIEARADVDQELLPATMNGSEQVLIAKLNEGADAMSEKVEREVKRLFPPHINVQADMRFEQGSLLMAGTVAILSWIGSTALDVLKEQAQEQLAALVKMAVQRVTSREISAMGARPAVGTMKMSVAPVRFPAPAVERPQPASVAAGASPSGAAAAGSLAAAQWLPWGVAIVFLLQVLLVLDRFVVVQLR